MSRYRYRALRRGSIPEHIFDRPNFPWFGPLAVVESRKSPARVNAPEYPDAPIGAPEPGCAASRHRVGSRLYRLPQYSGS